MKTIFIVRLATAAAASVGIAALAWWLVRTDEPRQYIVMDPVTITISRRP